MLPIALTLLLGFALILSVALAFLVKRGWRTFWACLATALLVVIIFLMWPGGYLNRYWFAPQATTFGGTCDTSTVVYDDMGELNPAKVTTMTGPAIYEWWDEAAMPTDLEGVQLIPAGQTVTVTGLRGHWWKLPADISQICLKAVWAAHVHDYGQKPQHVGKSYDQLVVAPPVELILDGTKATDNGNSTSPCEDVYVVQPGDGRILIAEKCDRTWSQIAVENGLKDNYALYPGAELRIP